MDIQLLFWFAPLGAVLALVFAYIFYSEMMASDPGTERSQEIAGYVREGAMSYLWQQYRIVAMFFVAAFAFFAFFAAIFDSGMREHDANVMKRAAIQTLIIARESNRYFMAISFR